MDMTERERLEGNIGKFSLYNALSGVFFSVPVMVLFWQENGLSLTEVMVLQSLFAIATVALEIPSGYFADIHGRRRTLAISGLGIFVGMSVYSLGHNFMQFLIAELIFAVGVSLSSGTSSALVYDTLRNLDREESYQKIWGSAQSWVMLTLAGSNVLGGFIGKIELRYTLFASLPFFAMLFPVACTMVEPERQKPVIEKGYARELSRIVRSVMLDRPKLKWIIIFSGVVFAFNQSVLWLYQPYFRLTGLDIIHLGFVFAAFQVAAALSARYAYAVEDRLGPRYALSMMVFLVAGSYLLMSSFIYVFSFAFCFLQQFVRGFKGAVITDYVNRLSSSDTRATILSMESFVGRLSYAVIIPLVGWVADAYSLIQALQVLAVTSFVCGLGILSVLRRQNVI